MTDREQLVARLAGVIGRADCAWYEGCGESWGVYVAGAVVNSLAANRPLVDMVVGTAKVTR